MNEDGGKADKRGVDEMQDSKGAEVREEPCEITTDGWCATHSTADGPVYCERDAAARGVEWTTR